MSKASELLNKFQISEINYKLMIKTIIEDIIPKLEEIADNTGEDKRHISQEFSYQLQQVFK